MISLSRALVLMTGLFVIGPQAHSECGAVASDLSLMTLPSAQYQGVMHDVLFQGYANPADPGAIYFRLTRDGPSAAVNAAANADAALNLSIHCVEHAGTRYTAFLAPAAVLEGTLDWKVISIGLVGPGGDTVPLADPITVSANPSVPYFEQQLSGHDADGDVLIYELASPAAGAGYQAAYVNPNSGKLYLTLTPTSASAISVTYRVTDGAHYSPPALVTLALGVFKDNEAGSEEIEPSVYASFNLSGFNSDLLGAPNDEPTPPSSIDLSPSFPVPGDQGQQNSCVGWAVAYALKSYQEKIENDWPLNTSDHLFSPAFVYNQINDGEDQGCHISDALDLAVQHGIASLATMPYSALDYLGQPTSAAVSEASRYRAQSWSRVNDTSQIKAALANRKPVIGGVRVYPSFGKLEGVNSVYNTASNNDLGGHAITIVGYDDNRFGGAFRVINSWGSDWGDNGYFWMPYDFASQGTLTQAYVLEDRENDPRPLPDPVNPTEPVQDDDLLPNLVVSSWTIPSYDPRPRGRGVLQYTVLNNGQGVAAAGFDVNLMLSRNAEISSSDHYVIYETISFELEPGESAYRDDNNAIDFQLPDNLESGDYYFAVWVDDLNTTPESNEYDNVSRASGVEHIANLLPDLVVNDWYAQWDGWGNGTLSYEIINNGASPAYTPDWYVNLILDWDQVVGNGNETFLFYERAGNILNPGSYIYRDASSVARFSLYQDHDGWSVAPGVYYIGLWVDDLNAVEESNELNNGSYSWGRVTVGGLGAVSQSMAADDVVTEAIPDPQSAHNGRRPLGQGVSMQKVELTRTPEGGMTMRVLSANDGPSLAIGEAIQTKRAKAAAQVLFPVTNATPMPGGSALE